MARCSCYYYFLQIQCKCMTGISYLALESTNAAATLQINFLKWLYASIFLMYNTELFHSYRLALGNNVFLKCTRVLSGPLCDPEFWVFSGQKNHNFSGFWPKISLFFWMSKESEKSSVVCRGVYSSRRPNLFLWHIFFALKSQKTKQRDNGMYI